MLSRTIFLRHSPLSVYERIMNLNPMTFATSTRPDQLKGGKFPASPFFRTGHANEVHQRGRDLGFNAVGRQGQFHCQAWKRGGQRADASGGNGRTETHAKLADFHPGTECYPSGDLRRIQTGTDEIDLWRLAKRGMALLAVGPPPMPRRPALGRRSTCRLSMERPYLTIRPETAMASSIPADHYVNIPGSQFQLR